MIFFIFFNPLDFADLFPNAADGGAHADSLFDIPRFFALHLYDFAFQT